MLHFFSEPESLFSFKDDIWHTVGHPDDLYHQHNVHYGTLLVPRCCYTAKQVEQLATDLKVYNLQATWKCCYDGPYTVYNLLSVF